MFCCKLLYVHFSIVIILMWKRGLVAFAWFVLLVSRGGWVALTHGVIGLSAVCDCGIS